MWGQKFVLRDIAAAGHCLSLKVGLMYIKWNVGTKVCFEGHSGRRTLSVPESWVDVHKMEWCYLTLASIVEMAPIDITDTAHGNMTPPWDIGGNMVEWKTCAHNPIMSRDLSILNAQLPIGYLTLASIVEMVPIDITNTAHGNMTPPWDIGGNVVEWKTCLTLNLCRETSQYWMRSCWYVTWH
jgi:hypothetical protein